MLFTRVLVRCGSLLSAQVEGAIALHVGGSSKAALEYKTMQETIGIIAGRGQFPRMVARGIRDAGMRVAVCGLVGHADPSLEQDADAFMPLHLGQLTKPLKFFRKLGVRRMCFAGAVAKPKAFDIRPDFRFARTLLKTGSLGDDAVLRAIIGEIESEGIEVVQAANFVTDLHAPAGILAGARIDEELWRDIRYGWPIARAIGNMDIGQCIVVKKRMVVAVECLEGTDATLRRAGELGGAGCVALKLVKPGQDERVDLPAIGLETIRVLIEAKYACLAYEAGKTLFFDMQESLELAEKHGLCLIGIEPEQILNA